MGRAFLITILPITNAEERRIMENSERKTAFLLGEHGMLTKKRQNNRKIPIIQQSTL